MSDAVPGHAKTHVLDFTFSVLYCQRSILFNDLSTYATWPALLHSQEIMVQAWKRTHSAIIRSLLYCWCTLWRISNLVHFPVVCSVQDWVMGWAECFRHQAGAFTFVFRVQSLTVAWNELSVCIGCLQGKIDVICVSLGMNSFFLSLYK